VSSDFRESGQSRKEGKWIRIGGRGGNFVREALVGVITGKKRKEKKTLKTGGGEGYVGRENKKEQRKTFHKEREGNPGEKKPNTKRQGYRKRKAMKLKQI